VKSPGNRLGGAQCRRSREFPLSEAQRAEFREFESRRGGKRPRTGRRFHSASERDLPHYKINALSLTLTWPWWSGARVDAAGRHAVYYHFTPLRPLVGRDMHPEISWFLAVGAGVLSFFSPCILPLLPAYLSFISGATVEEVLEHRPARRQVMPQVLLFCLGFSLVFVLMGATASTLGQMIFRYQRLIQWIGGALVIFFGLHLIGLLQWRVLHVEKRLHLANRPAHALAAFVIGLAFAAGWTPCIGPILGSILTFAGTRETLTQGIALLVLYSFGLSVPFVAVGLAIGSLLPWLQKVSSLMRWLSMTSGLLLILMGVLLLTDNLTVMFRWAI
jgi:cytochrome c-type biogenesis protein